MNLDETYSAQYMEAQYHKWRENSKSVTEDWRHFFQGFELGRAEEPTTGVCTEDQVLKQVRVESLKYRYRDLGHLLSCLDPLAACPTEHPLLSLEAFELKPEDWNDFFYTKRFGRDGKATLREIVQVLRETYCRSIGVEYMHLQDPAERRWLQDRMEPIRNRPDYDKETRLWILRKLFHAAVFESQLNKKYPAQTRFSLEGAEGLIPVLAAMVHKITDAGGTDIVLGMSHRGRLNVLVNILQKPYADIFQEFANSYDAESIIGSGDVKYHNGYLAELPLADSRILRIFLVNNPSHLESVDPVVEGVTRGLQERRARDRGEAADIDPRAVWPILIHGDAAFTGQGVVMETLNLSQLPGYRTGGTIHVIVNNQIGYTTLPENARSTRYSTDLAKMLMIPIFHVHGENPEALVHVARLACDYRHRFGKDVVVDLVCYRRHGHNEGDEPYFTQPTMYERIRRRPSVHRIYADELIQAGIISAEEANHEEEGVIRCIEDQFEAQRDTVHPFPKPLFYKYIEGYSGPYQPVDIDTGVAERDLLELSRRLYRLPTAFKAHPKLARIFENRLSALEKGEGIDWANAETLAFATILRQGRPIRLSGQDSIRGTFSQRHAIAYDRESEAMYSPLESIAKDQGKFSIFNSSLSETGVLGFEYGYSLVQPEGLVIWEAQFGDFANNAQSVIDLYIAAGETKWQRLSGLVLLLPHGWEGLGPEHSSARLERFLQLCAGDNMIVCNPTTPGQYFHLLRRQVFAPWRKPLIIMTPKSLLRHPLAVSKLSELSSGGFQTILDDPLPARKACRVIFTSGKIFYELIQHREAVKAEGIFIIRLEQYHPFPEEMLKKIIKKYSEAFEWLWVQEEPENMGAYSFIRPRLEALIGKPIIYAGRKASASPATGFHNIYREEQKTISERAIEKTCFT